MINPIRQSYANSVAPRLEQGAKSEKTALNGKVEDKKVALAQQIEAGEYQFDKKATAQAIVQTLIED